MEKPNTVRIERDGEVVRIEVTTESEYEGMKLFDEFVARAHANGEVTLSMIMCDDQGKPKLAAVPN